MKLLMMSMILLYFLPVMCSGHRAYPRQRTSYLSREQFHRICLEIADLKKADEDLKKANEDLIKANEDLQNRIIALEDSSNAAGKLISCVKRNPVL